MEMPAHRSVCAITDRTAARKSPDNNSHGLAVRNKRDDGQATNSMRQAFFCLVLDVAENVRMHRIACEPHPAEAFRGLTHVWLRGDMKIRKVMEHVESDSGRPMLKQNQKVAA